MVNSLLEEVEEVFNFEDCCQEANLYIFDNLQVDQIDISSDGNLLHFAVIKDLKEHVRILLEHGLVSFSWQKGSLNDMNQMCAVDLRSNLS